MDIISSLKDFEPTFIDVIQIIMGIMQSSFVVSKELFSLHIKVLSPFNQIININFYLNLRILLNKDTIQHLFQMHITESGHNQYYTRLKSQDFQSKSNDSTYVWN